jgi:hypothetical protein
MWLRGLFGLGGLFVCLCFGRGGRLVLRCLLRYFVRSGSFPSCVSSWELYNCSTQTKKKSFLLHWMTFLQAFLVSVEYLLQREPYLSLI